MLADANTGLLAPFTFFYGNLIGNSGTGNGPTLAITSSTDENGARSHGGTAAITNIYDYNRDGFVNSSDENAARSGNTAMKFIKVASNAPLAPNASPAIVPAVSPAVSVTPATVAVPAATSPVGATAASTATSPSPVSAIVGISARRGDTGLASGLANLLVSARRHTPLPSRLDMPSGGPQKTNLDSGAAATIFGALAKADAKTAVAANHKIGNLSDSVTDKRELDDTRLHWLLLDLGLD